MIYTIRLSQLMLIQYTIVSILCLYLNDLQIGISKNLQKFYAY